MGFLLSFLYLNITKAISGEPLVYPPNISIISPVNNTNYFTSSLDLNWTSNETLNWCAYSLDSKANNTKICYFIAQDIENQAGYFGDWLTSTNAHDENWDTFTTLNLNAEGFIYTNYSLSLPAVAWIEWKGVVEDVADPQYLNLSCRNGTTWSLIDSKKDIGINPFLANISVPLPDCYNEGKIQFRFHAFNTEVSPSFFEDKLWYKNISNITLTFLSEGLHNITIYANNTAGKIGQSSYVYFIVNQTPQWSNNKTNITSETILNDVGQFNITLTDNVNLSSAIFSWNVSGFWLNLTQINFTITTTNITIIENRTINQSLGKNKAWTVYFNDSIGNKNQTDIFTFNIANILPNISNVSITPLSSIQGDTITGHGLFNDSDSDSSGGNQTYWYVNKTIINQANNSFTLLGGNVTPLANITFSIRYNDTYDWGGWKNSTTITVGDTTAPTFKGNRTNPTSVQRDLTIDLFVNATDAVGIVDIVRAEINNTQIKNNFTISCFVLSSAVL